MYNSIVIGGGIVGSSVAYHLSKAGERTLLLDRRDEGRATTAGAGIVSPTSSSRTADDRWFELALSAAAYYPDLIDSLRDQQDGETGYAEYRHLTMAVGRDELAAFDDWRERTRTRRRDDDRLASVTDLAPEGVPERWPGIAVPRRAALLDSAARVNGQRLAAALRRAGGENLDTAREDATRIVVDDGGVTGVVTDADRYGASSVVVAGGAWSPAFADQLGTALPITPQRGQIAHLDAGDLATDALPIVSGFRGHYLVPWDDGRIVAGATRETGTGFEPNLTVAGVREVLDEAARVAPMLDGASVEEFRVGLRPTCEDGLPVLGPLPDVEGAYVATGHGATGLQLGPYTGRLVARSVVDGTDDIADDPFGARRFG